MVKKTQIIPVPPIVAVPKIQVPQVPKIKVLAAVPACHIDHVKYREQVKRAIQVNLAANPDVEVSFVVDEECDNSVDTTNSWNAVVAKFQVLSDRTVAEGFDYLWLVEADVIVPENALSRLLGDEADIAAAVVPYKFQNDEYWMKIGFAKGQRPAGGEIYNGMACTGYFIPDAQGNPTFETQTMYISGVHGEELNIKDKLLIGSPTHMIFNGTGCILLSKAVLAKIKWRWDNKVSGFDVYYWQDAQRLGFKCVTDGYVICQHLGA